MPESEPVFEMSFRFTREHDGRFKVHTRPAYGGGLSNPWSLMGRYESLAAVQAEVGSEFVYQANRELQAEGWGSLGAGEGTNDDRDDHSDVHGA